jgi:hypothetical protein
MYLDLNSGDTREYKHDINIEGALNVRVSTQNTMYQCYWTNPRYDNPCNAHCNKKSTTSRYYKPYRPAPVKYSANI